MKAHPRSSVHILPLVVTLVCAYFGAWEATKKFGVYKLSEPRVREEPLAGTGWVINEPDPDKRFIPPGTMSAVAMVYNASSPAPLVVVCHELKLGEPPGKKGRLRYYLWLFGATFKIHEVKISDEEVFKSYPGHF